jgi:hypothetical protein
VRDRGVSAAFRSAVAAFFLFLLAAASVSAIFGRPPELAEDEMPPPEPPRA